MMTLPRGSAVPTLALGSVIQGRYRLDSLLGTGGSGTVFRAQDLSLGRPVAVKLVRPGEGVDHTRERFEREARVGAALSHPHVVQTLDFGQADEATLFLVTQLVEGGDLLRYELDHPRIPIATVVRIAHQIAEALAAAHAIGMVHRDLKPENVLVELRDGRPWVYVGDFGLAYLVAPADARQGRLTTDGSICGTPPYMSPEQVSAGTLGPASDVYAFGCLLYELITGVVPFVGAQGKVMASHLYAPPKPPRELREHVPSALDELVLRMLGKVPVARPTSAMVRNRLALLLPSGELDLPPDEEPASFGGRLARMITQSPIEDEIDEPVASGRPRIALGGELTVDLLAAFAVAGLDVVGADEPAAVRVALGATIDRLVVLVAAGTPVIADAEPADFPRITRLLRLGVADVVMRPVVPATLVTKVQRILRRGI
jgi:serine/threonine protein kinase